MAKISPADFVRQVRQETSKVTWPTRKETLTATAMVFVLSTLAALFFLAVDQIIGWGIGAILQLGS
jgi:preprotein translocase subunit SecE